MKWNEIKKDVDYSETFLIR